MSRRSTTQQALLAIALPAAPPCVATIFGPREDAARRYVALLAEVGVEWGVIGPREIPRLWDRHLLNCAVIGDVIPPDARVIDVGSGAGLPGIALALARPDLAITLMEPMARRAAFLTLAVQELGLGRVDVLRGRAPESSTGRSADVVTARAVAPLDRLVGWCLPLVGTEGRLLAIKGRSAQVEIDDSRDAVRQAGGSPAGIRICGVGSVDPPTTVVEIVRGSSRATRSSAR